jgi:hypothetical protein
MLVRFAEIKKGVYVSGERLPFHPDSLAFPESRAANSSRGLGETDRRPMPLAELRQTRSPLYNLQ